MIVEKLYKIIDETLTTEKLLKFNYELEKNGYYNIVLVRDQCETRLSVRSNNRNIGVFSGLHKNNNSTFSFYSGSMANSLGNIISKSHLANYGIKRIGATYLSKNVTGTLLIQNIDVFSTARVQVLLEKIKE